MKEVKETAGGSNCQPIIYTIDEVKKHLHPDLVPFFDEAGDELPFHTIRHPLIYVVPFWLTGYEINRANESYTVKTEWIQRHIDEGDFRAAIFLYERPYRLSALLPFQNEKRLSQAEFWRLAGDVWTDSENIHENMWNWEELFEGKDQEETFLMMSEKEKAEFAQLPDELTIYRGTSYGSDPGLSYTLNREKAEWFANRFPKKNAEPVVVRRTIQKEDVVAYFTARNESEIVIRPELIWDIEDHEIMS